MHRTRVLHTCFFCFLLFLPQLNAQDDKPEASYILIQNVKIFDGVNDRLAPGHVLIENNLIKEVGAINSVPQGATVIDGGGRILMPGLSDAHAHLTLVANPHKLRNDLHWTYIGALAGREAERMLLRGFTTIRDAGGPSYGLAKAIDEGLIPGPRIYPSGHLITQTSGHGDFRSYNEPHPSISGHRGFFEREWAFIADGKPQVTAAVRETLRLGATQIKVNAGGGIASSYDPIDTLQYSAEEMRAAVVAAENWNTYVLVHAYTDAAIRQALNAGVKSIEHGMLMEEETMALIKEKDAFLSPQALIFSLTDEQLAEMPTAIRLKGQPVSDGLNRMMSLARKHKVKVAFGVDSFGSPEKLAAQSKEFRSRLKWFTPVEILRQTTSINAELFAMCGPRNPYKEGPLGVIKAGAYADILVVDGNPLDDITVLEDYEENIDLIMKDGRVYKNTLN